MPHEGERILVQRSQAIRVCCPHQYSVVFKPPRSALTFVGPPLLRRPAGPSPTRGGDLLRSLELSRRAIQRLSCKGYSLILIDKSGFIYFSCFFPL